ncbi:MAG: mobile mystery protein B [Alphaproteobacteria bacterium]|nr:mobile mystery protein B [Alphaproteobacteria bacterium]
MITYHYIDGQTPLDEDEKRDLIPTILTREDLDRFEQENILEARQWVMQKSVLARQDIFTESFILNLHKRMYGHVWKWAGQYRKSNKNIGVDSYQIPVELRKLLDDAKYWLEHDTYTITHLAIIFHHRLVKIHLFPNGNGRHARLCADAIIAKYDGEPLSWGSSPDLNKPDEVRRRYIRALQEADHGNYEPLIAFATS